MTHENYYSVLFTFRDIFLFWKLYKYRDSCDIPEGWHEFPVVIKEDKVENLPLGLPVTEKYVHN